MREQGGSIKLLAHTQADTGHHIHGTRTAVLTQVVKKLDEPFHGACLIHLYAFCLFLSSFPLATYSCAFLPIILMQCCVLHSFPPRKHFFPPKSHSSAFTLVRCCVHWLLQASDWVTAGSRKPRRQPKMRKCQCWSVSRLSCWTKYCPRP